MNKKYFKPLVIIIALIIVCITTIVSYAYFVASVRSNASANVITTGNMEVTYENGQEVGTTENMIPGDYVTKTFSVTNTGDVYALYDIYLTEVINSFVNTDELVYELISEDGTNLSQRECPGQETLIAANNGLDVGQTHHYTLKITFLNKDYSQDDNQGATFSTKVSLVQSFQTTRKVASYINNDEIYYDLLSPNASVENFYNTYHKEIYLKQNAVISTASLTKAYLYEKAYLFYTMQECEEYSLNYSEEDYIFRCEIEEGHGARFYFANKNEAYLTEELCIEESNALHMYYDDNCKLFEISETPVEVLANKNITSTKLCIYNSGNEICLDPVQPYRFNYVEGPRPPTVEEQQIITFINNYADFSCETAYQEMRCIHKFNSNHNAIEISTSPYGYITIIYETEAYNLYGYIESFNSESECQDFATNYDNYECIYENGQYNAYYHRNKQYISIQECEEDANHYSYSNHICQLSGDYTSLDVCSSSSKGKPRCEMSAK